MSRRRRGTGDSGPDPGPDDFVFPPSAELVRQVSGTIDKFWVMQNLIGFRHAHQALRAIGRLHTFYPGQRGEADYTKYVIWLLPNSGSKEPHVYHTGLTFDHASGVITGCEVTAQPSAASAISLFKRSVLPKQLWLPPGAQQYASDWDCSGVVRLIATDNAMDLTAISVLLMHLTFGTIVLLLPPGRGDLKGTNERGNYTVETQAISLLEGYVQLEHAFTHPSSRLIIEKAKGTAKYTVAEYLIKLILAILDYNYSEHPRFKNRSRMQVYRHGLEMAPPILPTGRTLIDTTFALTFPGLKVTRTGVTVPLFPHFPFTYNSEELNQVFRTSDIRVDAKINPDDVTSALFMSTRLGAPVRAKLTTHALPAGTPLDVARHALRINEKPEDGFVDDQTRLLESILNLQEFGLQDVPGRRNEIAQAATKAAAMPPVTAPAPRDVTDDDYASVFPSTLRKPAE